MTAASEEEAPSAGSSRKKCRITLAPPARPLCSEDESEETYHDDDPELEQDDGEEEQSQGESDQDPSEEDETEQLEEEEESAGVHEGSSDPAWAPLPSRVVIADVTVQDADVLECGVCFFPLKPPIFQCEVGHVVCSPCRDKLTAAGKCYVCGVPTTGGYRRCHGMEHLVESIRVPCPNAAYGCAARSAFYDLRAHRRACAHAPCHCPGEACGFVGSTAGLLGHLAAAHDWPCATRVRAGETFGILLHDGFNFVRVDHGAAADYNQGATILFLLNMTREPLGRAISVLCIHPHANAAYANDDAGNGPSSMTTTQCELLFVSRYGYSGDGGLCRSHYQKSEFLVPCTDLSNGLPDPGDCFQFLVPNSVLGDDGKAAIQVRARIIIN